MTGAAFQARDRCAIAGVGQTAFTRDSGVSVLSLATKACLAALADAGLEPGDVDGIVRCQLDKVDTNSLAATAGFSNVTYWGEVSNGGMAPPAQIGQAMAAILAGLATTVVCFRSLNGRSEDRFGSGEHRSATPVVGGRGSYDEYFLPFGLMTPGQVFALLAQRHMAEFGTTSEQLGAVSVICREHANQTPHAQLHGQTLTLEQHQDARMISTPLRLYDFCLETDGACAVVVTSAERARDMKRPPVLIRSVAQAIPANNRAGMMYSSLLRDDITNLAWTEVAEVLWTRAGLGPSDIDVAQLYDCFTISVILQLESFGFCGRGEGGPLAASGTLARGGDMPMNTGGGHLSEGYIHGMNHVVQAVRQLRGDADMQIEGAETSLVTGGPLPISSALVLRRG